MCVEELLGQGVQGVTHQSGERLVVHVSTSKPVDAVQQRPGRCPPVRNPVLVLGGRLGEREVPPRGLEHRVVPEAVEAPGCRSDGALGDALDLKVARAAAARRPAPWPAGATRHRAHTNRALRSAAPSSSARSLADVLRVGRAFPREPGRVDAGPSAQGRHLQPRIVCEHGLPAAKRLEHGLSLEPRIRGEGLAGLRRQSVTPDGRGST